MRVQATLISKLIFNDLKSLYLGVLLQVKLNQNILNNKIPKQYLAKINLASY